MRGDDSTHRGSRFMISASDSVMERLASRRASIAAAAMRSLQSGAGGGGGALGLDEESGALGEFCTAAVDAFFDNDLIRSTRMFLKSARGSFGLCITSSLDADRQVVLAARGQTMSVAFYPTLGLVLYGSEQAAVKAALGRQVPPGAGGAPSHPAQDSEPAFRLDLDDLGGEICLLDWAGSAGLPSLQVSRKEANLRHYAVMRDKVTVTLIRWGTIAQSSLCRHGMVWHRNT